MRYGNLVMCAVSLLAVAACSDPSGVNEQPDPGPVALVRFINAVPDTGTVDLRFVDRVENLPTLQGVAFRSTSGFYQRVEPGSRAARIFPNSTNPELTKIFLVDTTVPLAADTRYTLVYAGRARAGAPAAEGHRLAVIEDPRDPPTPPANQIAIKALHVAVGTGNVDVYRAGRIGNGGYPGGLRNQQRRGGAQRFISGSEQLRERSGTPDYGWCTVPVRGDGCGFHHTTLRGDTESPRCRSPRRWASRPRHGWGAARRADLRVCADHRHCPRLHTWDPAIDHCHPDSNGRVDRRQSA